MIHHVVENSHIHSVLMDGVVMYHKTGQILEKVVTILCAEQDALTIVDAAKAFCPESAVEINKGIRPFAASTRATSLAVPADRTPLARGRARRSSSRGPSDH
jgi:hypothetical protein